MGVVAFGVVCVDSYFVGGAVWEGGCVPFASVWCCCVLAYLGVGGCVVWSVLECCGVYSAALVGCCCVCCCCVGGDVCVVLWVC